ncbi:MAG: MFS transporter [Burkholderiales bacterium]|nr:MFS transporter [Burkholderiales bacterium]
MSREELRASLSLASLFALRMLGLFLILPVFAVHAPQLAGGDNLVLVGLALGAYGLTQALLQIPFGIASDRYGRKRVIVLGLVLFAAGGFVAAAATDIYWTIVGRAVQGAGAISAAVTAFVADLTRDEQRTKAMAIIGASIGAMFAVSLVAAPALYRAIGMSGIFALTGVLAVAAIVVVLGIVPAEPARRPEAPPEAGFGAVLAEGELARLDFGVFALHAVQMAMFVVVPHALVASGGLPVAEHWKVYLPALAVSLVLVLPVILHVERKRQVKAAFLGAIALLALAQGGFLAFGGTLAGLAVLLVAFFAAFNVLEAVLPSLVSRAAPAAARGAALGIYNTSQSLGLFAGGAIGGWIAQAAGAGGVHLFAAGLAAVWAIIAASMRVPPHTASRTIQIGRVDDPERLRAALARVNGVREAIVIPERGVAHLTVTPGWDERSVEELVRGGA